jgi:hypothetical protein
MVVRNIYDVSLFPGIRRRILLRKRLLRPGKRPVVQRILQRTEALRTVDRRPRLRPHLDSQRRERLSPLRHQRILGVDRLRKHLGFEFFVGMGALPLRALALQRPLRMGLDSRLRMGAGLGNLEKRRRLLRMGAYGAGRFYQRQRKHSGAVLDFPPFGTHVQPQYEPLLRPLQPHYLQQDYGHQQHLHI